jgi:CRP/FNR family transcriptional regulator
MDDAFRAHPDLQQALEKLAATVKKAEGVVLFRQGQRAKGVYLLRRGKALLSVRAVPGGLVSPRTVGPGAVLGLPANITGKPYSLTAETLQDCELGFVEREKLVKLLRKDGKLCLHAVEILGRELAVLRNELAGSPQPHALGAAVI